MVQQVQNTFTSNNQNDTLYLNYAVNNLLLQLNTFFPAKIISVDGLQCTIETLLIPKGVNQSSPNPIQITNVPISQLIGGNAGIIINYQIGNTVLCGAIQRDISLMKNGWNATIPPSNRKFSISDAVVLFNLSNSLPTTYLKITDSGGIELTTSSSQPINLNTAGVANINANQVNVGTGAVNAPLLQNIPITATITGVTAGTDIVTTTLTATAGGSSNVKIKS